jgi:hypothetical protein
LLQKRAEIRPDLDWDNQAKAHARPSAHVPDPGISPLALVSSQIAAKITGLALPRYLLLK